MEPTTSLIFLVIWFSIFSVIAMVGMLKFLIIVVLATSIGVWVGLTLALWVLAICGTVLLWLYGSFWTTMFVIFLGGSAFMGEGDCFALIMATMYSTYCAWTYVGWLGLLIGLNLSFISNDVLMDFLIHKSKPEDFFDGDINPSTSGADHDSQITSEDEVVRLLNCTDHYSALGFSWFDNIDFSALRRKYKKKEKLVFPQRKAYEKLLNAYERERVSTKELIREELPDLFLRMYIASQNLRSIASDWLFNFLTNTGGIEGILEFILIVCFFGRPLAFWELAISGTVLLWLYGSFWTTMLVIFLGGLTFTLGRQRIALLIIVVYSTNCAWTYVGWMAGLICLPVQIHSLFGAIIYILHGNP